MAMNHETRQFFVSKLHPSEDPIILRFSTEQYQKTVDAFKTLQEIKTENNLVSHEGKNCVGRAEKIRWWERRKELDERLRELLDVVGSCFGCFKVCRKFESVPYLP
jgi:hypothetical protein